MCVQTGAVVYFEEVAGSHREKRQLRIDERRRRRGCVGAGGAPVVVASGGGGVGDERWVDVGEAYGEPLVGVAHVVAEVECKRIDDKLLGLLTSAMAYGYGYGYGYGLVSSVDFELDYESTVKYSSTVQYNTVYTDYTVV